MKQINFITSSEERKELQGKTIKNVLFCSGTNEHLTNYISIIFDDDTYVIIGMEDLTDTIEGSNMRYYSFCDKDISLFENEMYRIIDKSNEENIDINEFFNNVYYLRNLIEEGVLKPTPENHKEYEIRNYDDEKKERYRQYLELKREFEDAK